MRPLSGFGYLMLAVVAAGGAAWLRACLLRRPLRQRAQRMLKWWPGARHRSAAFAVLFALPGSIAALLLALATAPGTAAWAAAEGWFAVALLESASWLMFLGRWPRGWQLMGSRMPLDEPAIAPELTQQITRSISGEVETIHALVRCVIAVGDRQATVHLAFCPPLAETPQLEAHALDHEEAEVRVAQAATFGARLEIRLLEKPIAPRQILVEVLGAAKCPSALPVRRVG